MSPRVTVVAAKPVVPRGGPTAPRPNPPLLSQKPKPPPLFYTSSPPAVAAGGVGVPSAFSRLRRGTAPPAAAHYADAPVRNVPSVGGGYDPTAPVPLPDGTGYLKRGKLEPTPMYASMPDSMQQYYKSRLIAQLCELAAKKPEYGIDVRSLPLWSTEKLHSTLSGFTDTFKINSKILKYKFWFMVVTVVIQLFFTHVLGLNATGFANAQFRIIMSNRYDALLTEIGEKHSMVSTESGSPELRLAMVVGVNLLIFVGLHLLGQFIAWKTGGGKLAIAACEQAHGYLLDLFAPPEPARPAAADHASDEAMGIPSIRQPRDELAESQAFAKQCLNVGENFVNTLGLTGGLFGLGGGGGAKKAPSAPPTATKLDMPPPPTKPNPPTAPTKPTFSRGAFKDE